MKLVDLLDVVNAYMVCIKNFGKERAHKILSYYTDGIEPAACYNIPDIKMEDSIKSFSAGKVVKNVD